MITEELTEVLLSNRVITDVRQVTKCPFWRQKNFDRILAAESFEEIADQAFDVLDRMHPPISELCGPISTGGFGCHHKNLKLFLRCVQELRNRDMNPFDQGPIQYGFDKLIPRWRAEHGSGYCMPILEVVYHRIFHSGKIARTYFLPGWESSFGTNWERKTVVSLGIEINDFPQHWYDPIIQELSVGFGTEPPALLSA